MSLPDILIVVHQHTTLRSRLERDEPFQDWYRGSFLYGSYRRNTAIKEIKDVDVCVELGIDTDDHAPAAVVDRLRRVLERQGYAAKTALQRRSVRIDMSGTTLDVVPVVDAIISRGAYLIPDRRLERWVETHPKAHIAAVQARNRACNKRFVPLAKIVRAWFRYQTAGRDRPRPKGFALEALLFALQDQDAPSYAEAFVNFLTEVDTRFGATLEAGEFPPVPDPGKAGTELKLRVDPDEAKRFVRIVRDSLEQARTALQADTVADSAAGWRDVFGPDFPEAPEPAAKGAEAEADRDEDGYGAALEEEISELDLPSDTPALLATGRDPAPPAPLRLTAQLARSEHGTPYERYPSNGRALPKSWWIVFTADTGAVPAPFEVVWTVENHGGEATRANDLGHIRTAYIEAARAVVSTRRSTAYRGSHTMVCEIRKDGRVVARGRHVVNVKRSYS